MGRFRVGQIGGWIVLLTCSSLSWASDDIADFSPAPSEQQLPTAMHSRMEHLPRIRVGQDEGDMIGRDHRVLQAAVDYIASLGGGTVEIGPGQFFMRDSLHLRANVTVRGTPEKTVLFKAASKTSPLAIDGDYGEQQITLVDPEGFDVGKGVAIWDANSGGFHTTVARITGKQDNRFSIDKPLNADCMIGNKAMAATVFPVVSGYDIVGARVENLIIDGNKDENASLNGCRGAGIFLYRSYGTVIDRCVVRNYHGDGISFQQSNDVVVTHCVSENNADLGLHPGSGSQRPRIENCVAQNNGTDGLFLCWRVRHGLFQNNTLQNNGRFGISIGHKDSDNLLQQNLVRRNASNGVFFRNETLGMGAHRNRLVENTIEDNGSEPGTAAIRIRGATNDLVFERNTIRETRAEKKQTVGVLIEEHVGAVTLTENNVGVETPVVDRRVKAGSEENNGSPASP